MFRVVLVAVNVDVGVSGQENPFFQSFLIKVDNVQGGADSKGCSYAC